MYNNETAGPAFEEFLDLLGQRVRLKGFTKYRAQLDNKSKLHISALILQRQACRVSLSEWSCYSGLDPGSCLASLFGMQFRFPQMSKGSTFLQRSVSRELRGQLFFLCDSGRESPQCFMKNLFIFSSFFQPNLFHYTPVPVHQGRALHSFLKKAEYQHIHSCHAHGLILFMSGFMALTGELQR